MKTTFALILLVIAITQVHAHPGKDYREAKKACISETGKDRAKIKACLKEKGIAKPQRPKMDGVTKAAFKECAVTHGIARPQKGQRPSKQERETITACLAEKGITLPPRGSRKNRAI